MTKKKVLIIGAGPAGLTAAYQLCHPVDQSTQNRVELEIVVIEKHPKLVGGISRTEEFSGYRFDIGGHRFFSKSEEIESLWQQVLKDEMLVRPRKSRIFYQQKFFSYPLRPFEALFKLGLASSIWSVLSFIRIRLFPIRPVRSFQDWVSNEFGRHLFSIFFKSYTEKVWGMKCSEISADWAKQRIKGVSLYSAVVSAFFKGHQSVKSLIESFKYPRLGPGMMWDKFAQVIQSKGVTLKMDCTVQTLIRSSSGKLLTVFSDGESKEFDHVISSAPLGQVYQWLDFQSKDILQLLCHKLRYRDFITVALVFDQKPSFDDNWIYIHDPNLQVGRIQNYASWSIDLLADPNKSCFGLEYFCHEGQGFWQQSDSELIDLAKEEMSKMNLVDPSKFLFAKVIRQEKAYPVYDHGYELVVKQIKDLVYQNFPELQFIGRNGMHRYNNQDHSMMTGLLAAKNILNDNLKYDLWSVNEDAEYHEVAGQKLSSRQIPRSIESPMT